MIRYAQHPQRGYMMMATDDSYQVTVTLSQNPNFAYVYVTERSTGDWFEQELTKDQITHFLSLDTAYQFRTFALCLSQAQA